MEGNTLNEQELKAIQETLRQSTTRKSAVLNAGADVMPLVLLRDDRAADQAKPSARQLGVRWSKMIPKGLFNLVGVRLAASLQSTEIATVGSLREELEHCWLCPIEIPERSSYALVAMSGPMLCSLVVKLLGGDLENPVEPHVSMTTMRLFGPIGEGLVRLLMQAYRDELGGSLKLYSDQEPREFWRGKVPESELVAVVSISVQGATSGTIRALLCPSALVSQSMPSDAPIITTNTDEVLGEVLVESSILLGSAAITMSRLASLKLGDVISLDRFLRDPLPFYCAGVLTAHGQIVLDGESLMLELTALVSKPNK
jgi:flagellar motor switch protein FliN